MRKKKLKPKQLRSVSDGRPCKDHSGPDCWTCLNIYPTLQVFTYEFADTFIGNSMLLFFHRKIKIKFKKAHCKKKKMTFSLKKKSCIKKKNLTE